MDLLEVGIIWNQVGLGDCIEQWLDPVVQILNPAISPPDPDLDGKFDISKPDRLLAHYMSYLLLKLSSMYS